MDKSIKFVTEWSSDTFLPLNIFMFIVSSCCSSKNYSIWHVSAKLRSIYVYEQPHLH